MWERPCVWGRQRIKLATIPPCGPKSYPMTFVALPAAPAAEVENCEQPREPPRSAESLPAVPGVPCAGLNSLTDALELKFGDDADGLWCTTHTIQGVLKHIPRLGVKELFSGD